MSNTKKSNGTGTESKTESKAATKASAVDAKLVKQLESRLSQLEKAATENLTSKDVNSAVSKGLSHVGEFSKEFIGENKAPTVTSVVEGNYNSIVDMGGKLGSLSGEVDNINKKIAGKTKWFAGLGVAALLATNIAAHYRINEIAGAENEEFEEEIPSENY